MTSITASRGLSIGGLSRLTGVNIETIRYYERIQLMQEPCRTGAGRRTYGHEDAERLRFIRRARALGFGTKEIRTLFSLAAPGTNSCAEAREMAADRLADVRAKRDDLAKLEIILAGTIARCDARCCVRPAPVCPVLEMLET